MNTHLDKEIRDLLDPEKGFILRRGVLTPQQADSYRNECWEFLNTTRTVYKRISRYTKRDYVWSTDGKIIPGDRTYRIYQALQAKHSDQTQAIFSKMLALRDQIESNWVHNKQYRELRSGLWNYVQATTYARHSEGIARHCDFKGDSPYPLLQTLIFLSQPGIDYIGGDLILHTKCGHAINIQKTLQMQKGDAVLFDKSLYHEVLPTEPCGSSKIGRWTVVIGARYPQPPSLLGRLWSFPRSVLVKSKHRVALFVGYHRVAKRD